MNQGNIRDEESLKKGSCLNSEGTERTFEQIMSQ